MGRGLHGGGIFLGGKARESCKDKETCDRKEINP